MTDRPSSPSPSSPPLHPPLHPPLQPPLQPPLRPHPPHPFPPESSSAAAARATSPFPNPSIPRVPSTSSLSLDDLHAPDAVAALAGIQGPDLDMEPSSSGHRRRRSSLMNSLDASAHAKSKRPHRAPSDANRIQEETKLGTGDDDLSTSDDVELSAMSDDEGLQDDEETGLTGKDKQKRRKRRRRNTLLDHRIAGGDGQATHEEKKEATKSVVKNSLINVCLIGLWYLFSLSISMYNKWMFDPKYLDFPFPLFTTCVHMLVQFSLASLVLIFLPQFRPRSDALSNPHDTHPDADRVQHDEQSTKPLMTRMFYLTRIGPCGMATGLDIGLGNMSLKLITLTFYTMCKSSSLAFVLLFAFVFRLESPSWRLIAIIATMTAGVIMMVAGEVEFSALGFILVISAAFFSGFRWGLTQILLLRNPATSNPFASIFYLAPVMFLSLFVLAVPVEGFPALFDGLATLIEKKGVILGPCVLLFPGMIAFCMTASEFALLKRTSVVTLSIAGIFKEVVTISAAGIVFDDTLTPVNISGLVVTIAAIAAYNYIKISKMRDEAIKQAHKNRLEADDDSASDADGETEDDDDPDDWARRDDSYVTSDGDIMPGPSRPEPRSAISPRTRPEEQHLHPSRAQMEALAASKRELSD